MSSKEESSKDVKTMYHDLDEEDIDESIMYPDPDDEEIDESIRYPDPDDEEMGKRIASSSPSVLSRVSSKYLYNSQTDYDSHESGNVILEGYDLWILKERNKLIQFQESKTRGSSQKKTEEEPKGIKGTFENIKRLQQGQQITSSSPFVPPGVSSQDLSNFFTDYDRQERGNLSLEDYVKQQQTKMWLHEERNKHFQFQKLETRRLSKKKTKEEPKGIKGQFQNIERLQQEGLWLQELLTDPFQKLGVSSTPFEKKLDEDQEGSVRNVSRTYFTASDEEDEEAGDVIFKLKISDTKPHLIPYEIASSHFTSQTLQLRDHLDRDWEVTLHYDDETHSYVIKGLTPYLELYHLNPSDIIQVCCPLSKLHPDHFDIQYQKKLGNPLFEVEVPESNRLLIPYDLAAEFFNPSKASLAPDHLREHPLHLTDHLNQTWEMKFVCHEDEKAYAVVSGWEEYVDEYRLEHKDTIRFFRQDPSSEEENSFIIYHKLDSSSV